MVKRKKLTPQEIVDAAIELYDGGERKQFSMRKLAAHLGVDPMAIYYHIPNRAALIALVVNTIISKCELPQEVSSWQEGVKEICMAFRKLAHQHPSIILIYEETEDLLPGALRLLEAMHAALAVGGFEKHDTVKAARLMLAYTENFCEWELTGWIEAYTEEMRTELTDALKEGDYPVTVQHYDDMVNVDVDVEFEFGLDVLIVGLERKFGTE